MKRTDIINWYLSKKTPPVYYLEVGVQNPIGNFNKIKADVKHGVDPCPIGPCKYIMTSDEFFRQNITFYDLIFVDGDHVDEQAYRDTCNALRFLKPHGMVIMHDCNPPTQWHQRPVALEDGPWNGTVWKAFVKFRLENEKIEMFVIDTDWGIGVLNPDGNQGLFSCSQNIFDYNVFDKRRKEALNLISESDWIKKVNYNV